LIQNKDIIGFSTKAVTIVRKHYLSHYFFNLLILFNTPYHKAIKLKRTCYWANSKKGGIFLALKGAIYQPRATPWVIHYNDLSPERATHKKTIIIGSTFM